MMTCAIKKISVEGEDSEFFLFSEFVDQKKLMLRVLNLNDSEAYFGCVKECDLRCMAVDVRLTYSNFLKDTLCAVSLENPLNIKFTYALEKVDPGYQFKWKKVLGDDVKINLGSVCLQQKEFQSALSEILTDISLSFLNTNSKLKEATDSLKEMEKEKGRVLGVLEESTKVKENLEKEMYSKFVIVLNNKKRKIRELYETIESMNRKKSRPSKSKVKTNKEENGKTTRAKNVQDPIDEPGPSKIMKKNPDPLFTFSDDDDVVSVPVPKCIRPRERKKIIYDSKTTTIKSNCDKSVKVKVNENIVNSDESVDGLLDLL